MRGFITGKRLAGAGLAVILLLIAALNFSSSESRYECTGVLHRGQSTLEANLYFQLSRYRWWVGLWSDSDGYLLVEVPGRVNAAFSNLKVIGHQIQIASSHQQINGLMGYFSTLSNTLELETSAGQFVGQCAARP